MLLIIILILLFGGLGGGYWGHANYGPNGGLGIGFGTILLLFLLLYMFGGLRHF